MTKRKAQITTTDLRGLVFPGKDGNPVEVLEKEPQGYHFGKAAYWTVGNLTTGVEWSMLESDIRSRIKVKKMVKEISRPTFKIKVI